MPSELGGSSPDLRVVELTYRSALDEVASAWERLYATANVSDFFGSPHWLIPWITAYWGADRLAIATVYRGQELVGVVPFLRPEPAKGLCRQAFVTPINAHIRQLGIVSAVDARDTLVAVLRHLTHAPDRGSIVLHQVQSNSALDSSVTEARDALGLLEYPYAHAPGAFADLSAGWEAYAAARRGQVAREMRRKEKKLLKGGDWELQCTESAADADSAFAAVVHVESRSWKHPQGTSVANEPGAQAFYADVCRRAAAAGQLRTYVLSQAGQPMAHVFGVVHRNGYLAIKTAYDESARSWSPGAVLMWHAVRDAAQRGCQRFDFLGYATGWKEDLGTDFPNYTSRFVFRRTQWRCRARRFGELTLKPLAKRAGLHRLRNRLRSKPASNEG